MVLGQITHFLQSMQPISQSKIFDFEVKPTELDEKTIRSAVLVFNLSPRESNLISSYRVTEIRTSIWDNLKEGNSSTWCRLALFVGVVAVTLLVGHYTISYGIHAYKEACIKVASGTWGVYDQFNQFIRPAEVSDFLPIPLALGFFDAIGSLFILGWAWKFLEQSRKSLWRVEVTIKPMERTLPEILANEKEEGAFVDPISLERIPENEIASGRFIYLSNYVIGSTVCLKRLLDMAPKPDRVGYLRFDHPLEGHQLEIEDAFALEEHLEEIFGLEVAEIAIPQLASLGNSASLTPHQKIENFLNLFDSSVYEHLKGFETDIHRLSGENVNGGEEL